ncbi:hypothetical protein B0I27_102413 [Arcticibacter pallidicorallinus]|uniref:TspO/MBR related protein n=1 Tax=Arcticibacter pallidicorallinus TaxID=1259464 RepID=A0A2T0U9N3_9SPHI|nr:tryptophan-rich sensory protein [Arcticibacter pallidicorallinus]PRY54643.1 hypothetical protein B0I27_102413 [Arcticibacter pallidicorallinus]
MNRIKSLAILNAVCFLIAFAVSTLSQVDAISSKNIGDVSDKYDTLFTPAGVTFSIWGVIYIALFAFSIYHIYRAFREDVLSEANKDISRMGVLFIVNNIATAAWVFAWVNEQFILSVLLMLTQLVTLIVINVRLKIFNPHRSVYSKIFTHFPLGIYFAWICIATIANISSALVGLGWDGGGVSANYWTIILIAGAALVSTAVIILKKNVFFGPVVIWAFYGIILKHNDGDPALYKDIISAAWGGIACVGLAECIQLYINYTQAQKRSNKSVDPDQPPVLD